MMPTIRVIYAERSSGQQIIVLCARCGQRVAYCDQHGCRPARGAA